MPSYPTLVGTYFTLISFSIETFVLGYLEMFPPTPGYVGTCYFINSQQQGYRSTTQNPCHQSPFVRPRTISVTICHKNYKEFLSLDLHFSWLWVIQKPTLHRSAFSRPQNVSIVVSHKHYKVSLFSDLHSSWLWVNHTKLLSSTGLHIQQRILRRELHAMWTISS